MLSGTSPVRKALAGLAVPLLVLGAAGCGLEKTESAKNSASPSSDAPGAADGGTQAAPDGTCAYVPDGEASRKVNAPSAEPDLKKSYTVTLATSIGELELELDSDRAPCTVNNFVSLADQGYFDGTTCHRVIPEFMAQCGDPSATGAGGPGYRFDDELYGDESYVPGAVAMANAGPATNGSQFFIVTGDATHLSTHTVFGHATDASLKKLVAAEQQASVEGIQVTSVKVS